MRGRKVFVFERNPRKSSSSFSRGNFLAFVFHPLSPSIVPSHPSYFSKTAFIEIDLASPDRGRRRHQVLERTCGHLRAPLFRSLKLSPADGLVIRSKIAKAALFRKYSSAEHDTVMWNNSRASFRLPPGAMILIYHMRNCQDERRRSDPERRYFPCFAHPRNLLLSVGLFLSEIQNPIRFIFYRIWYSD